MRKNAVSNKRWATNYCPYEIELNLRLIGQKRACREIAAIMASSVVRQQSLATLPSARCLIVGPTSAGKSHLVQQVVDLLKWPHAWLNLSLMTPPGYRGFDVNCGLRQLAQAVRGGSRRAHGQQASVLVLDEADKAVRRARNDAWIDQLQYALLPILGGEPVQISDDSESTPISSFSTRDTLIFMMGVFPEIPTSCWSTDRQARKALVRYGFCEEIVSRLTHIVHLDSLNERDLRGLLTREAEQIKALYQTGSYSPTLTEQEIRRLISGLRKCPFGVRGSRMLVHRLLMQKASARARKDAI